MTYDSTQATDTDIPRLIRSVNSSYSITALVNLGDAVIKPILEHWDDEQSYNYKEALAYILGRIGSDKAKIALIHLLRHSDDRIKPIAIKMLLSTEMDNGDTSLQYDAIVNELKNCHDVEARKQLIRAVVSGHGEAAQKVRSSLISNLDNEELIFRIWLSGVLLQGPDRQGYDVAYEKALRDFQELIDVDDPLSIYGIEALMNYKPFVYRDDRVLDAVLPFMQSKNATVRAAAVEAVAKIGGKKVVNHLLNALQDSDYEVYITAYDGLKKIGVQHFDVEVLLESKNAVVRAQAIEDFARTCGKKAVASLIKAFFDPEYIVSSAAFNALKDLGVDNIDQELLLASAEAERAKIKNEALDLIRKLEDAKDLDPHIRALFCGDPSKQQAAMDVLENYDIEADNLLDMVSDYRANVHRLRDLVEYTR